MSKIAILGAGGRLGGRLVTEALALELRVNAVTHDPRKLRFSNELCNVLKADLATGVDLEDAIAGCRWIVSAVSSDHPSELVAHLIKAVGKRRVERLLFVARADDTVPPHGLAQRLAAAVGHRKEKLAGELAGSIDLLRASGLPYVVLKTTGLTDEPGGKHVVCGAIGKSAPGPVSRADLARFILKILEDPDWAMREVNVGLV